MMRACKFNYTEPSIGIGGRPHCCECVHTVDANGHRHYGIIKTLSPHDRDFGKLVLYCDKQDGYVKPYAWCDELDPMYKTIGTKL